MKEHHIQLFSVIYSKTKCKNILHFVLELQWLYYICELFAIINPYFKVPIF